eukprot:COSAG02_NODE_2481_length_8726_cov_65.689231_7_plen_149_part_00
MSELCEKCVTLRARSILSLTFVWHHRPQHMFNIFNARQYPGDHWPTRDNTLRGAPSVGLLGGVEIRTCGNGPILCDHECAYRRFLHSRDRQPTAPATLSIMLVDRTVCLTDTVEWEVVGLGESRRAENSWTKGVLREPNGTVVAESLT